MEGFTSVGIKRRRGHHSPRGFVLLMEYSDRLASPCSRLKIALQWSCIPRGLDRKEEQGCVTNQGRSDFWYDECFWAPSKEERVRIANVAPRILVKHPISGRSSIQYNDDG